MPSCVLRYCKNSSRNASKSEGVTFHRFPRHDTREIWIKYVQKERSEATWLPTEHSNLCSVHFKDSDMYLTKDGRRYLNKHAVPYTLVFFYLSLMKNVLANYFFIVVPNTFLSSTSPTTSQHDDTPQKRIAPLPKAKTIIANVYDFLQAEYENLKSYTGGSCDFSLLANIVKRTAEATRVSETTVKAILEERSSEEYSHEPVSSKRARLTYDFEDDVSPIEEDSDESADDAQHFDGESNNDIEEHPIETLKVEIDENEEYHSEANQGILFQIQPLSTQQLSAIHQSLPPTAPTHAEVKQEPVDVEDHEQLDAGDAGKDTSSFQVPMCESTSAVHHLLQSNFEATSEPTNHEHQGMDFSSTSTTQVERRPD